VILGLLRAEQPEVSERLLERKNYVDGDPGELISGSAVIKSGVVRSITTLP